MTEEKAAVETKKLSQEEILEVISKWTVLELSEFVTKFEQKFGVTAAAPMVGMMPAGAGGGDAGAAEVKDEFEVVLKEFGAQKIQVIKKIRQIIPGLGLKEAKEIVEAAPKTIKEDATKDEAEKMKKELEEVGAVVELK